jgi:hypothetical protein
MARNRQLSESYLNNSSERRKIIPLSGAANLTWCGPVTEVENLLKRSLCLSRTLTGILVRNPLLRSKACGRSCIGCIDDASTSDALAAWLQSDIKLVNFANELASWPSLPTHGEA